MRRKVRVPIAGALLALIALAAFGRVVRDRSAALALLLYLPALLLGVVAVAYDLLHRGRAFPKAPCALAAVGLLAVAFEAAHLTGWRRPPAARVPVADAATGGSPAVTLVHWNVLWGGSKRGTDGPWLAISAELRSRNPDVVVLSEAPPEPWVRRWLASMGPEWSAAYHEGTTSARYRSQLAVCSRWPVRHERDVRLPNGSGVVARVDLPGDGRRALRVLAADGRSSLRLHRTPLLAELARVCDEAARAGEPVDVIAGDFNAVSRSIGFDDFRNAGGGYELASDYAGGWRGTFPSFLPLYDIDHVWVRRGGAWAIEGCELFATTDSDHRGHVVRLRR